jgi:hypothetical protein
MTVALVQVTGLALTTSQGPGAVSVAQAFSSANTAGNSILVFGFANPNFSNIPDFNTGSVTDSAGNTYTAIFNYYPGNRGLFSWGFWVPSILAGANTVTFHATASSSAGGTTGQLGILIAEYSGMSAALVQSYGAIRASALSSVVSLTDQYSNAVTDTFACASVNNNPGAFAIDWSVGASDIRICAACESDLISVTDSVFGPFAVEFTTAASLPGTNGGGYLQLWDGAPYFPADQLAFLRRGLPVIAEAAEEILARRSFLPWIAARPPYNLAFLRNNRVGYGRP